MLAWTELDINNSGQTIVPNQHGREILETVGPPQFSTKGEAVETIIQIILAVALIGAATARRRLKRLCCGFDDYFFNGLLSWMSLERREFSPRLSLKPKSKSY